MTTAQLTRSTAAASLVAGAALTAVSVVTMPPFAGDQATVRLQSIAEASGSATLSAVSWVLAQPFLVIGVLGVTRLTRDRAPVLSALAAVLVSAGAFGHAVYGGVNLVLLSMAEDLESVHVHAAVLDRLDAGLAVPFMAAGLLGTVLGTVLLGLAIWRGRVGPRWVGPALVAWVFLEFAGSGISSWAGYASAVVYAMILGCLALVVHRSSAAHWQTVAESAPSREPLGV